MEIAPAATSVLFRFAARALLIAVAAPLVAHAADQKPLLADAKIILLHHSTGECIWNGGVPAWFQSHNAAHGTRYSIAEQAFPKDSPYGWENYPYDYWNIWVRNAGGKPFRQEPTLEMLTGKYNVIVLKHCFPVSNIEADDGRPDVTSPERRVGNYKLQYAALKKKMREFPNVGFLVWTGAAQVTGDTDEAQARRAKTFFEWVRTEWDEKGDNIYVWDFWTLETEGGLYAKPANTSGDAHPNESFSRRVAPLLCRRIVDVIQGRGDTGDLLGRSETYRPPTPAPKPPAEPAPTPPLVQPVASEPAIGTPAGPGTWVFDNAEDAAVRALRWPEAVAYTDDGKERVLSIDFTKGNEEDWGDYGRQRVVWTNPPAKNHDISDFRYLAFRVKTEREMEIVLTLMTLPAPSGPRHQSHFGFSAYLHPQAGKWTWIALDLTRLELTAEGEEAYAKAGEPARPMHLTGLRLVTSAKNEQARVLVDDIVFLRELPRELKSSLQMP
ncbi:MAG: hypothetical protein RBS80_09445 [Thermoguttaceae bacterium]|jgi:hypothetical protein|nr:hypothetical protein [Thermoguttaceae bacterium]